MASPAVAQQDEILCRERLSSSDPLKHPCYRAPPGRLRVRVLDAKWMAAHTPGLSFTLRYSVAPSISAHSRLEKRFSIKRRMGS